MNSQITIVFASIVNIINRHRSFASLFIVFWGIILSDMLFHYFYIDIISQIEILFGIEQDTHDAVDLHSLLKFGGGY